MVGLAVKGQTVIKVTAGSQAARLGVQVHAGTSIIRVLNLYSYYATTYVLNGTA